MPTPKSLAHQTRQSPSSNVVVGERKQITVLFADITGSLELIADSDPEEANNLLDSTLSMMADAVHRYDGTVNKVMGDGIMALFGAPIALEDHAVRACYAALAIRDAVSRAAGDTRMRFGVEPQVRIGLNSGEVVVRSVGNDLSIDYDAIGPTTHLAGRMEQLAIPGTVRLTNSTLRLAEGFVRAKSLGPVPVRGLDEPVEIFELEGAMASRSRFQAAVARGLTLFVGRAAEMKALHDALVRAAAGHGQAVALVGEAGVGKSRLCYELAHSHRTDAMLVLENRLVSYGKATAYFPVVDLLKGYFGIDDSDDPRRLREKVIGKVLTLDEGLRPTLTPLLELLGASAGDPDWETLEPTQRRQRTLDAARALLLRESRVQPLVVVFEDLHWIDKESEAFLDSFIDSLPAAPILLLVNYRPEYRHAWSGRSHFTEHRLDPLPPESATELLDALLGRDASLTPLKRILVERTDGNPFFAEECVRTLIETGTLEGRPGDWKMTGDVTDLEMPSTVQGVIQARIDRLPVEEKQLLQTAAVVGKDVSYTILSEIARIPERVLRKQLKNLQRKEFIYEVQVFPDMEYTFKHAHTHEVAYAGMLSDRKYDLHRQIVEAIESRFADRLTEHVELMAHHAFRGGLWDRAVTFYQQSAEKAAARSAYREAAANLEQALVALDHLPTSDQAQGQSIDIRFDLRSWLQAIGEHERVVSHLRDAERLSRDLNDRSRLGWASAYLSQYQWWMDNTSEAETLGRRALSLATEVEDAALMAVANFFLGQGFFNTGDYRRAIKHCGRNAEEIRGEMLHQRLGLTGLPSVLSRVWLAWALAEQGNFEEAQRQADEALVIAEEAGQQYSITAGALCIGHVRLLRGAFEEATPILERAAELSRTWGMRVFFPMTASVLGLAYARCGRLAEALPLLEEGAGEATPTRIFETSSMVTALGRGYLLGGRLDEAETQARHALALATKRAFRGNQARALHLLGEALTYQVSPDAETAEASFRQALAHAEELGMRPLAAHCHLGLGRLFGKVGDENGWDAHLKQALTMYQQMGMDSWCNAVKLEREAGIETS